MFSVFTAADPGAHMADAVMSGGVKSTPMLSALLTQSARAMPVSSEEERVRQDIILERIGAQPTGNAESLLGQGTAFEALTKFSPPLIPGVGPSLSDLLFEEGADAYNESSDGEAAAGAAGSYSGGGGGGGGAV